MRVTTRSAAIMSAAAKLFAEKGYHGAGVEELGRMVGLQRGALYHHIGSKESILHEIGRHSMLRLLGASRDDPTTSIEGRLRALSRSLMTDIALHQDEWTVFFREVGWLTGERREEIFALREQYEQRWLTVLQDGVEHGLLRPVHPVMVKGILGMHNYSYLWLRPRGELTPDDIADGFVDILLSGLKVGSSSA